MPKRWFSPAAVLGAGLFLAPLVGLGLLRGSDEVRPATGAKAPPKTEAATCGSFGTSVEFVDTPSEAATKAKKEEKLVFVLHVSGNFEDPRFT
jgi:hypothetical protein